MPFIVTNPLERDLDVFLPNQHPLDGKARAWLHALRDQLDLASAMEARSYAMDRAARALQVSGKNLLFEFYPFYAWHTSRLGQAITGTGTTGVAQGTRFNATGSDVTRGALTAAGTAKFIQSAAAKEWWIGGNFALTSATYEANSWGGVCVGDGAGAETVIVGARGSTSATHFMAWGGAGSAITSNLPLDTLFHNHEFYRKNSAGIYVIDEVERGTNTAAATADATLAFVASSGIAANRSVTFCWGAAAAVKD